MDGLGAPIEEFRTSLLKFDCSLIFALDRAPNWYNHQTSIEALECAAALASDYQNVAVLGESMGASGALLFADFCPAVDRILALAPQYSVALPFASFDARFAEFGRSNPEQTFWAFAPAAARPKAHVLFGDRDFADSVHAGMFVLEGFQVAKQLKKGGSENHLNLLLRALLDFSAPLNGETIKRALGEMAAPRAIDPDFSFAADQKVNAMFRRNCGHARLLPPPENAVNISKGRRTSQSSLSQWSNGKTLEEDSARD